jgi:hypothetical protein
VSADVETAAFLGESYDVEQARLEVRFWYPAGVDYEYYRINWVEPTRELMLGFHRDSDHPDIGQCHLQLDHEDSTITRSGVAFSDGHPLAVLDARLQQIPAVLTEMQWENGHPSLTE